MKQYFAWLLLAATSLMAAAPDTLIDSRMTFDEAVQGLGAPDATLAELRLVTVHYWGFDKHLHEGQILCHRRAVDDIEALFTLIERIHFPIRSAIPVSRWNGSDAASMAHDNSSGFAWRTIWGSRVPSWHMQGLALDLNPRENPAFHHGTLSPPDGKLVAGAPGTLSDTSQVVRFLRARGWRWGAHWRRVQDWQHFEKPLR